MSALLRRAEKWQELEEDNKIASVNAASVHDIKKIVEPKRQISREEKKAQLPDQICHHFLAFEADKNDHSNLSPHCEGVDLAIEIEKD